MSVFDHIKGNDLVKQYLTNMVKRSAVANSLLFAGPQDALKEEFAIAFAKLLMGEIAHEKIDSETHPDLHIYRPEGKIGMHSIATMRQFCEEVYMPPFENAKKVFIIHDADRMLTYSANALLKTFEEPSLDSVIILLSSNPSALLPTVLSRCRVVRFHPLNNLKLKDIDIPHRKEVIDILTTSIHTYTELSKNASRLAEIVDELKQNEEDLIKSELAQVPTEQLNAFQKQTLEKELEGAATISLNTQAKSILHIILSWYRDLHLLQVNANPNLLENGDHIDILKRQLQRKLLPLETIQKAIKDTITSIEKSTSLPLSFERLLLELQLL